MNHLVRVRCRNILISDRYIVANNINTDTIELDLDDEWSGFTPVVVLGTGESAFAGIFRDSHFISWRAA